MTPSVAVRLGALAFALGMLAAGAVPGVGGRPAAAAAATTEDVALDVEAIGPGVLRPGGMLGARATVRNAGSTVLEGVSVRLLGYSVRLRSRDGVRNWAAGESGIVAGDRLLSDTPLDPVPPGESARVDISVPAASFGLPPTPSSWGPRGLTLDVFDSGDDTQLAVARGFTVWDPRAPEAASTDTTTVSVLAPVSAGAPDIADAVVPASRMAELTRSGGRLARVLDVASRPDVAWALDPTVLTSAAAASEDPAAGADAAGATPTDRAAPAGDRATVASWLAALRAAAAGRDVLALPQADPDLAAVAHAGAGELYRLASRQGRETVSQLLEASVRTDVAWPATGGADTASVQLAADAGATLLVLSAGAQPPLRSQEVTLTGRSTVMAGAARLDGLLVETALSTALTAATGSGSPGGGAVSDDPELATSLLLADTAVITREEPEDGAHLLLALPRDWAPDPGAAATALDALRTAPWVRHAPLGELVTTEPEDVERSPVRLSRADQAGELPADGIRQALTAVGSVRGVASALTEADRVLDDVESSAVAATAAGWRQDRQGWTEQVAALADRAREVRTGVHVLPGSAVNVVSSTADLPVSIVNDLDQEVVAAVRVQPRNPRLVVRGDVEVRLAAASTQRVAVPVRSVANGNTDVVVTVRSPDGAVLGEPVTITVRVRADWETRGMLLAGAVLAVVLVAGLVRTIRKGRRREDIGDPLKRADLEATR